MCAVVRGNVESGYSEQAVDVIFGVKSLEFSAIC
jgi:hypothetical protein